MSDDRLKNEIEYGKLVVEKHAGELWYWETPAGEVRKKRRVQWFNSQIRPGMQVLELGCGSGNFTKDFATTQANITAIDISPDLLDVARKNVSAGNVTFKVENAYQLNYGDNTFDRIIGSSVLHHLEIDKALKEFYRVLKPGGLILFTEPNLLNPHIFLIMKIPLIRKMASISKDETALIKWNIKKRLKAVGFQNISVVPFDFLHPLSPKSLIPLIQNTGLIVEKLPLLREIAGSLFLKAEKSR